MKAHVQNPFTRSPSLMVNMTVEEVQQLAEALHHLKKLYIMHSATGAGVMTDNEHDAFNQLKVTIDSALDNEQPNGLKGAIP